MFCAAVRAERAALARFTICEAYHNPDVAVEFRFCKRQPDDWAPFTERFPRAEWMQWPEPVAT